MISRAIDQISFFSEKSAWFIHAQSLKKIKVIKWRTEKDDLTQFLVLITIIILPHLQKLFWQRADGYMIMLTF